MVKVEGKMVSLRDLAQVSIKDAKTLMVNINDVEVNNLLNLSLEEDTPLIFAIEH